MNLMPSAIYHITWHHIQNISNSSSDKEEKLYWKRCLQHCWLEIISLNMERSIRIHWTINDICSEETKRLGEEFDTTRRTNMKKRANTKRKLECIGKHTDVPLKKKRRIEDRIESQCNRITYGVEKIRWCGVSDFRPNSVFIQCKQCMCCLVFTTAINATSDILIDFENLPSTVQHKLFLLLCKLSKQKRVHFASLMNMLKLYMSDHKEFTRA